MLLNANKYLNTTQYQYMTEGVSMAGLYMAPFIFTVAPLKYVKHGE